MNKKNYYRPKDLDCHIVDPYALTIRSTYSYYIRIADPHLYFHKVYLRVALLQ